MRPYTVIGVTEGDAIVWQVVRLYDLAVAGFDRNVLTSDGVQVNTTVCRSWGDYKAAEEFADGISDSPIEFNPVAPLVWVQRGLR